MPEVVEKIILTIKTALKEATVVTSVLHKSVKELIKGYRNSSMINPHVLAACAKIEKLLAKAARKGMERFQFAMSVQKELEGINSRLGMLSGDEREVARYSICVYERCIPRELLARTVPLS